MFKQLARQLITISPIEAQEYLGINTLKAQRPMRQNHVLSLSTKMKSGEFTTGEIAVVIMPDGTKFLVNGQHQLAAIIKSHVTIEALLQKFTCKDTLEVAQLFRQFDNFKVRSLGDMTNIETAALGVNWHSRTSALLVTALCVVQSPIDSSSWMTRDRKVEMIRHNIPEGDFLELLYHNTAATRAMRRGAVAAAAISTMRVDRRDALTFWVDVRDGEALTKDMPAYTLRAWLQNQYATKIIYRPAPSKEILHRCILAWNAFRKGKRTKLQYRGGNLPKIL